MYIGRDLVNSPLQGDITEEFEIVTLSITEFEELIKKNNIWDGLTLAAWLMVKNHLKL